MERPEAVRSLLDGSIVRQRIASLIVDLAWVPSALVALTLVLTYAVDIPYIDQWDGELPFLQKVASGEAGFSDLVALQLEHRPVINRLVALVVAWAAGWHTKACLLVNVFAVSAIVFNLLLLQRYSDDPSTCRSGVFSALTGIVMFSVPQYDSWFNPSMIAWFAVQVFLTGALLIAIFVSNNWLRFGACAFVAWIATFSASHGMLLWLALAPVLVARRWHEIRCVPYGWILAWVGMAVLAIGCYFWGYSKPADSPSVLASLGNPAALVGFFLANIGAPLAFGTPVPPIIQARISGAIIVTLIVISATLVLARVHRNPALVRTMPWFSLVAYALLTKAAISAGRAEFGPEVALASRYMPTANLTICALAALVPMVLDELVRGERANPPVVAWLSARSAKVIKATLLSALLGMEALNAIATLPTYANEHIRLTAAKAAVLFSRCFRDPELLSNVWSYKTVVDIEDKLDFMDAKGLLRPKTFRSPKVADLPRKRLESQAVSGVRGAIEQAGSVNEQAVGFVGWAIDPERRRPADVVLLSWEDDAFDATVFAIIPVGIKRPDVAAKLSSQSFAGAGWGRLLAVEGMPKRPCRIRAWAFDTDDGTIAELDGVVEWRPDDRSLR